MKNKIRNKTTLAMICGLLLLAAAVCAAQSGAASSAEQPKYYHLDFAVRELDSGRLVNARHYATTIATGGSGMDYGCTMRTGNKVPVPSGPAVPNESSGAFTYIDLGVNIDCRSAKEIQGSLALNVAAEISNAATSSSPPLIRQTKWSANVIVQIGKPTVIFSSDDITTKGQMQLELTATPIAAR